MSDPVIEEQVIPQEDVIVGGEVISRKTTGLKIPGIKRTFFKQVTEKYTAYLKTLKTIKKDALIKYNEEKNKKENVDKGYEYPFAAKVSKFEEKYLGDLILTQEILLRKLILQSLSQQSFQKLGFESLLPLTAKIYLSHAFALVIRYKRLHDIFFRAASVREKKESLGDWLSKSADKSIYTKYEMPSVQQMETIIQYSLDTPICLNLILSLNGLEQYNGSGVEMEADDKTPYRPKGPNGGILLGDDRKSKSKFFIDKDGKIKKVVGEGVFDVIGLSVEQLVTEDIDPQKTKPDEVAIDVMAQKTLVSNIGDFFYDRFTGAEYLPKGDNWVFKWDPKDQFLQHILQFRFREKLKDTDKDILPTIEIGRKSKTRRSELNGGKRTQKNRD
jgi:hypothetical protein